MRAQGMSINVIIIVVLALIVLIVLATISGSKLGIFSRTTSNCVQQGGTCAIACGEGAAIDKPISMPTGVCEDNQVCCTG